MVWFRITQVKCIETIRSSSVFCTHNISSGFDICQLQLVLHCRVSAADAELRRWANNRRCNRIRMRTMSGDKWRVVGSFGVNYLRQVLNWKSAWFSGFQVWVNVLDRQCGSMYSVQLCLVGWSLYSKYWVNRVSDSATMFAWGSRGCYQTSRAWS